MEITKTTNIAKISPEKLNAVKVHWIIVNKASQKSLENFNRVLANAQLRVYRESLASK